MSRRLERTDIVTTAENSAHTFLTVPADHKYEIIETGVFSSLTAGQTIATVLTAASGTVLPHSIWGNVANNPSIRFVDEGLALYEGDTWGVVVLGTTGATWAGWVSYVDVDFT